VIVMQRLHEHDLVGYVQWDEEWNVVNLPAIAEKDESFTVHSICGVDTLTRGIGDALHPERASRESLRSLFYKIGEASFYAQYQQAPLSSERSDEDVIGWPEGDEFDVVFQSWDISSDASHPFDCCAGSMWGVKGGKLYLLYLMQSPMVQGQAINFIDKMAEVGAPQLILLDDRTSGQHYAAALRPKFNVQVSAMNIAKAERIRMATQLLASDRVEIPWKAPWLDPFRRPLLAFSEDRDFDGEDSVSQALYWFQNHSAF
jgi:phage terminase large subunit-like protein